MGSEDLLQESLLFLWQKIALYDQMSDQMDDGEKSEHLMYKEYIRYIRTHVLF